MSAADYRMLSVSPLPASGGVRIQNRHSLRCIEIASDGVGPLTVVLRAWPFGQGGKLRFANASGSMTVHEWQAGALANAIDAALAPVKRVPNDPHWHLKDMTNAERSARLRELDAIPWARMTLPEREDFDWLDERRDQQRRYVEDVRAA